MRELGQLGDRLDHNCTNGVDWIREVGRATSARVQIFGDCVDNDLKMAAFVIGLVSLVLWLLPMMPQFFENYKNKSCDGVSVAFLLSWIIGDGCNALGASLTNQQAVQQIVGVIYVVQDTLVAAQFIYYTKFYKRPSRPPSRASAVILPCVALVSLGSFCLAGALFPDPAATVFRIKRSTSRVLAESSGHLGAPEWWPIFENYTDFIGYIIGCIASIVYCAGRIPQLVYSYKRQSCDGLSPLMFYITVAANFTYGLSVMLACTGWLYFWRHLPWIAGAVGWGFLDFLAIIQLQIYRNSHVVVDDSQQGLLEGRDDSAEE